jgi:histidinol dehydrogenase
MKTYSYKDLSKQQIEEICLRQLEDDSSIQDRVKNIVERVKAEGDIALRDYAQHFDQENLTKIYLVKE